MTYLYFKILQLHFKTLCFQARGFIAHQTPRAVYAAIYDDELRGKAYVRFKYEASGGCIPSSYSAFRHVHMFNSQRRIYSCNALV